MECDAIIQYNYYCCINGITQDCKFTVGISTFGILKYALEMNLRLNILVIFTTSALE